MLSYERRGTGGRLQFFFLQWRGCRRHLGFFSTFFSLIDCMLTSWQFFHYNLTNVMTFLHLYFSLSSCLLKKHPWASLFLLLLNFYFLLLVSLHIFFLSAQGCSLLHVIFFLLPSSLFPPSLNIFIRIFCMHRDVPFIHLSSHQNVINFSDECREKTNWPSESIIASWQTRSPSIKPFILFIIFLFLPLPFLVQYHDSVLVSIYFPFISAVHMIA